MHIVMFALKFTTMHGIAVKNILSILVDRSLSKRLRAQSGYTLVELLMALVVVAVVLTVAGILLTDFLKYSKRIEAGQSARESASRLNYLVQVETSEASEIDTDWTSTEYNSSPISECAYGTGDTPLFALVIPEKKGPYGTAGISAPIYYYLSENNLRRCGPQTKSNGELESSPDGTTQPAYVDGIVMKDVDLDVVSAVNTACGSDITDSKTLVYTLGFKKIPWVPSCVVARAKTVYVCNTFDPTLVGSDASIPAGSCPL